MPSLFVAESWVDEPSIRWFHRCDCCKRRFIRAKFYETYTHLHGDQALVWRWECSQCLINSITTVAESLMNAFQDIDKKTDSDTATTITSN